MSEKKMNSRLLAMLCDLDLIHLIVDDDDGRSQILLWKIFPMFSMIAQIEFKTFESRFDIFINFEQWLSLLQK
jgi:hypothetical protein